MYDTATSTAQCPQNWWKFFGFFCMDSYTWTKGVMAYGLCNIFLILTALLLPSHNCVNGRELLQQDFKQIFFKIQTHQILWKWFLSSNERDLLYSNTTLKWTFPLHPTEQILNCFDCWQTIYKLDTHVPCTPNISPPASNVIKQHSVWFQILCIWLQDLSKVPLGYQLFFLHYFSVVDAG